MTSSSGWYIEDVYFKSSSIGLDHLLDIPKMLHLHHPKSSVKSQVEGLAKAWVKVGKNFRPQHLGQGWSHVFSIFCCDGCSCICCISSLYVEDRTYFFQNISEHTWFKMFKHPPLVDDSIMYLLKSGLPAGEIARGYRDGCISYGSRDD